MRPSSRRSEMDKNDEYGPLVVDWYGPFFVFTDSVAGTNALRDLTSGL